MASRIALRSVRWFRSYACAHPSVVHRCSTPGFASSIVPSASPIVPYASLIVPYASPSIFRGFCSTPPAGIKVEENSEGVNENGCDYKHWLIQVKDPGGSRDEIIEGYIKLVAKVLESEVEAKQQIYSVSTRYYFAVGALMSQDVAFKFKHFPEVINVVPDCYVDKSTKDYGGEPFIDGKAVDYDPKYHSLYERVQARIKARQAAQAIQQAIKKQQPKQKPKQKKKGTQKPTPKK